MGWCMASGFTLAGFHLATLIQLKMALNNCCSPDLSNDRRQNDVAGWRPALGSVSALLQNSCDLVELTGIEPVTSCLQSRRSPN